MLEEKDKKDRSGIQVIARAAAILRVLKEERGGLSLGQIATRVDLPRSTVQRITGALSAERFIIQDPKGGGIRLGPELGAFAEAANFNIVERCRAILNEVTQATGETTDLAVLRNGSMIFLDQVPGLHRLRTVSSVGEVFPLSTTANGRACLALMTDDEALRLIEQETARALSVSDRQATLRKLAEIRETGLAYDIDEHTPGISAAGFAFRDLSGNYHAISVPVPTLRFAAVRPQLDAALRDARDRVQSEFPLDP
ncbi:MULTISPECIES: IclR family transcriptional regulator [Marinovum]|jgi:DNA-binding IclR family transcriptional regulator|uniref:Transcriptional regulator, IclR family n=1 Tax=Marinovum algicola TaxID=42444 RepID=A0A975WDY5_9RHOB|nr:MULTISPECIES: IclR family transcriptional regulator [Marinovum]AKO97819.1 Transcriptional regulator [Marinovum algicola DG 898]MDD9741693.1 IclR family transcriptional regulator [Marinovum sp. SP66]SEK04813.1 transcriptional regulator, IclR family [Marinovum algicola]SLN75103.1 HTH-type transcriptional regulator SrpS [Marinovum algicola]